ncbi:Protein bimA [Endocarpon pusillum Z07020]|uniref:Protein bimA n=1 Tax=Endocarpon pusillum (strain Z07020 / HMAS-L-300199) TaxID=1263415 RepID=U1HJV5_ENDPU|nr:Protein bimA [Endocarpon pusillum Z07020]ERF70530.1 Protein bimA [Endocarpon pusillum Z07020]
MSPSTNPYIVSQLRSQIYYHLDNNLVRNALFLASRLASYEPRSPEAAYLLSLCQLQSGQIKGAWETTRVHASRAIHLGCCYIYGQASLELGRYVEGITALERARPLWLNKNSWNQHSESKRQHLPDAAAVYTLQGKLFQAHKDMGKAVDCWVEALKLNPFMWDAFLGLCESGANINIPNIYKMTPEMISSMKLTIQNEKDLAVPSSAPLQSQPTNNPIPDPFLSSNLRANGISGYGSSALWEKLNGATISGVNISADEEGTLTATDEDNLQSRPTWEPPPAPARKQRSAQELVDYASAPPPRLGANSIKSRTRSKVGSEDAVLTVPDPPPAAPTKRTVSGQVATSQNGAPEGTRRSRRLLNTVQPTTTGGSKISSLASSFGLREGRDIKKAKAPAKGRTATTSTVGRVVSGNRNRADIMEVDRPPQKPPMTSQFNKDYDGLQSLLDLFSRMANGYFCLSRYDCHNAIQIFNSLPTQHRESPFILACIGKAYYEQASYADAEKFFIRVKQNSGSVLEDMEVYSTVLWHMKNEVELAYLAHELMETDRLSPQAWCAVGNSFSLQREHEQALKCFKRATQLDSGFAYGFTLQGHEFIANEEYDKALDAYRSGVHADPRHYNAWYGLGKVYEKMGKYDIAEQHYRTAARINPTNAVLVCCIGMVLEKNKNYEAALAQYSKACTLSPTSALSRFRKARVLVQLQQPKMALVELQILKDVAPDEANVFFLLGKLYKMLRMRADAVRCFTAALNLDPKAAQYIKDAMESLDDEEDEEEDEEGDMT